MVNLFQAPIPGQSLTDTPRNAPWERPAEMDTVEDTVKYYVGRLADQEVMDDLAVAFELGADLKTLTETIMLSGAMKGLHTVETGMLAGPVLAALIKAAMQSYGIDTPETPISLEQRATARQRERLNKIMAKAIEQGLQEGATEDDKGIALLQDAIDTSEMPDEQSSMDVKEDTMEVNTPDPSMGKGLMSRGGNV